jgi:hypothetical protein
MFVRPLRQCAGHLEQRSRRSNTVFARLRVCEHVAEFANTHAGKRSCLQMAVPEDQRISEQLLEQTR